METEALRRHTLARVPSSQAFHVCRGDTVTSIDDLANCIDSLTDEQFHYHVNPEEGFNHFSDWIRAVLKNESLAADLNFPENLHDKQRFVKTIRDHVAWLRTK